MQITYKKDGLVFNKVDSTVSEVDEDGNVLSTKSVLGDDLSIAKEIAIDTIKWQMGQEVQNKSGGTVLDTSVANAKAITLLAKIVASLNPDLTSLSALEKEAFAKLTGLADIGYADSDSLNTSLNEVANQIDLGTAKIVQVMEATTIDEVAVQLSVD